MRKEKLRRKSIWKWKYRPSRMEMNMACSGRWICSSHRIGAQKWRKVLKHWDQTISTYSGRRANWSRKASTKCEEQVGNSKTTSIRNVPASIFELWRMMNIWMLLNGIIIRRRWRSRTLDLRNQWVYGDVSSHISRRRSVRIATLRRRSRYRAMIPGWRRYGLTRRSAICSARRRFRLSCRSRKCPKSIALVLDIHLSDCKILVILASWIVYSSASSPQHHSQLIFWPSFQIKGPWGHKGWANPTSSSW